MPVVWDRGGASRSKGKWGRLVALTLLVLALGAEPASAADWSFFSSNFFSRLRERYKDYGKEVEEKIDAFESFAKAVEKQIEEKRKADEKRQEELEKEEEERKKELEKQEEERRKEEEKRQKEREKEEEERRKELEKEEEERRKEEEERQKEREKEEEERRKEEEKAEKEKEEEAPAEEEPHVPTLDELIASGSLGSLDSIPVPRPEHLEDFIKDETIVLEMGKALFWDMQVGSDGKTACATCHFHAGVDRRTKNTLAPRDGNFRGANYQLKAGDFPFHRLADPSRKRSSDNPVIFDTNEVVGSQGVIKRDFINVNPGSPVDDGVTVFDPTFNIDGVNARQVTGRNTPTMINAAFNDRNFWDGRANRFFNGVNPFGDMDPNARVWLAGEYPRMGKVAENQLPDFDAGGGYGLRPVAILLDNASLASQAVGPPNNGIEMAFSGRTFPELGRKLLSARPLALQKIHPEDSVLGYLANRDGKGLSGNWIYADFVRDGFDNRWWASHELTPDGYTQMEANFSLFWGLAVMMYERTLISDDSPFDQFVRGNKHALSESAKKGLDIFVNEGKCINCHSGPEFTSATVSQLRGVLSHEDEPMIEFMEMQIGPEAFYDAGFYNIGVRPTEIDLGVGARHPQFGPLSLTRRVQEGQDVDLNGQDVKIDDDDRVAVDGAFKTPTLRNIELTGPYMHNGGMRTLTEVVQFYARRADFFEENIDDLDPDVNGIEEIRGDPQRIQAVVDFLKSLTDDRVRRQCAPFDHPELVVPNGHLGVQYGLAIDDDVHIEAVGRNGGEPLKSFEEDLR